MIRIRVAKFISNTHWYKYLAGRVLMATQKITSDNGKHVYYIVPGHDSGQIVWSDDCEELPIDFLSVHPDPGIGFYRGRVSNIRSFVGFI